MEDGLNHVSHCNRSNRIFAVISIRKRLDLINYMDWDMAELCVEQTSVEYTPWDEIDETVLKH